ncbi:NAD(P)H-hydrate dehydratase [Arenibacterium halophilum]|uniref:Bifunctional NAD(P)H-hydrate repair enzyme n=1 Tax=Arenibacterium halophilum TaxID=2583821 RepID=A0ABY2XCG7_9RHOB|nr:NAD(P)H-hydrate dehydratase [Arenibacterium halophilum]TMV13748.1 NAD(P)H-hydrate dehydratase [Arenibacterium halophilum]
MRAIEQAAIDSGAVTGLELMERAGQGVVDAIFEEWPELAPGVAVVLCGPGNNGGDGFVVARLLKERGWEVEVYLYGDPGKLPPDARANYDRWAAMGEVHALGFPVLEPEAVSDLASLLVREITPDPAKRGRLPVALVVDGIFGTGLSRAPDALGPIFDLADNLHGATQARWIAIDVPTGLCADSGRIWPRGEAQDSPNAILSADLTIAFHRGKLGHAIGDGARWSDRVVVKDIGLDGLVYETEGSARPRAGAKRPPGGAVGRCPAMPGVVHLIQGPGGGLDKAAGHKFSHGHALILSGGSGRTGAARLAARGALRIGAGLVTLGVPGSAQLEVAAQVTAVMLRRVDDGDGMADVMQDKRINALCLGPGLGVERAAGLVAAALAAPHRPALVLDADALTAIARAPELFAALHDRCVLTPHGGEFARLFPDIDARLAEAPTRGPAYSKVDATREAAARCGAVVLFKGADTVIASPDGQCAVNAASYDRAAPWLATAGSGDVLAGFITGLLSRGFAPMQAAETAAWLHVECARAFGPGLIAEDLPEVLPRVLARLEAG